MAAKPKTYAQAVEQQRRAVAEARLSDPDEHFPYKLDTVLGLIDEDPPMGPGVPDRADGADDTSRTVGDYMTRQIAEASSGYVLAQETFLTDPSAENRQAYDAARDRLVAARLDHRQNRGQDFTVGAAARRAG